MADASLKLKRSYKPKKVVLEGPDGKEIPFETVDLVRSVSDKVEELEKDMFASDNAQQVKTFGQLLDVLLVSTNGNKAKPSEIVTKLWQDDDLSTREIAAFYADLTQAVQDPN